MMVEAISRCSQQIPPAGVGSLIEPGPPDFSMAYPPSDFRPVPNNIHMIWVGSEPGPKQDEYLRQWAKTNPNHTVMLWVDSTQFGAYATNKEARAKAESIFPNYQAERPMRGLFSQLNVITQALENRKDALPDRVGQNQVLLEINKELSAPGNKQLKALLLPGAGQVTPGNAAQVLHAFEKHMRATDDKFLQAEAVILDQTAKSWDRCVNNPPRDTNALGGLRERLGEFKNIQIRDLSNPADIRLKNQEAYQHEIVGRNGAYAAASDIARYEIANHYGGTYSDIDLECTQPLDGALRAHPDLMLVGMAEGKNEASGNATPYFANALFACHAGSAMVSSLIDNIGEQYRSMKGNEYSGDRYFSRPNKSTIETTGPNALRAQVDRVIRESQGRPDLSRNDAASLAERIWDKGLPQNEEFWTLVDSHFKFPDKLVNFETEEQQNSATKAMAGGAKPA